MTDGEVGGSRAVGDTGRRAGRARQLSQAEWWMQTVWGAQEGFACYALGRGGHFVGASYKFPRVGGWHQSFVRWPAPPGGLTRLAARLVDAAALDDVYVAPLLRSDEHRNKENGLPGNFLYEDLDDGLSEEQQSLLTRLLSRGRSFQVLSGRGVHVYIEIQAGPDLNAFTELNRRLAYAIGADSKWDAAAVLRLPGTFSHKGRARGGDSSLIVIDGLL